MSFYDKTDLWDALKDATPASKTTPVVTDSVQDTAAPDVSDSDQNTVSTQPEEATAASSTPAPENGVQDKETSTEEPADPGDSSVDSSLDIYTTALATPSSLEEEADTPPGKRHRWDTTKNSQAAAMHALGFGFDVAPMLPGTTDWAVDRESWTDGHGPGKTVKHWRENPHHELACIPGNDIIIFKADSPEAMVALAGIEARFELTSLFVVKTNTEEEHYFRRPAGTIVQADSQGTEKHIDHLTIMTGQVCVALPPSTGRSFKVFSAENKEDLPEATQEVIDAVQQYNDGIVPSRSSAQEETEDASSQTSEPEADTVNIDSPPDTSALATPQGSQLVRKQPSCLDNPQPLDSKLFPNQPRTGSNQLPATIANLRYMLKGYRIIVRYNVIKKNVEIILPGHSGSIDNLDDVAMTYIISLAILNGINTSQVPYYITALADENLYNPVADWILSKPWDEKDRKEDICETITVQEGYPIAFRNVLLCKWLLSAVAAALMPSGFKTRGVLVFQGRQGLGKTSWVRALVPDSQLGNMVVKVDHHLDISNKDTIIGAIGHWITEAGELDSSLKKDIARLKGFLTSDFDKVRQPYARKASVYPRQTVFIATVNQPDFLRDDTGNSRWWTIPVTKVNYAHGIDMQQLFAQLAVDFNNGKKWWLTQEEEALLNTHNLDHRSVSVIRERLLELVDLELISKDGNPAMTASMVLGEIDYKNPTNPQCKECGGILRELLGDPKKINGLQKWRIPLKRTKGFFTSIDDYDKY